ncbi:Fic family protein (plasmid) [Bacillus sp. JAS24-2]|uniref:Fic family protein n=1 Tax=Bacillus sp. JAS24-2 TaxID=2217832 RepID=UPI0011EC5AAA|nr:Fic/DOC family N-terminal domain-containing protein [Bacillus sp. JAS24-2]QEL82914.1 Fic family protein [Bacillus sp. JAS24-2]
MQPFVPLKLPFEEGIVNPLTFLNELISANTTIGQYQVMLNNSKISKDLLIYPLMLQEAVQSTKIEGTQVTLDEVLEVEARSRKNNQDTQEVFNYSRALMQGKRLLNSIPISTRMFKNLHEILLSNQVRGSNRSPGEYRKIQNFIGPEGCTIKTATFVPPEPQLVDDYMNNLEIYINSDEEDLNHLVRIAIIHAQFETIHPFLDGNGRIGRILIPLYLYNKGVIDYPNFFVSDILEKDKHKYYRYLNEVRFKRDWNQWIRFFLKSVSIQAQKNIRFIEELNELYKTDLNTACNLITNNSIRKIVDTMFKHPVFTTKLMIELTGINDNTCRRYLSILEKEGLIFSNERKRAKTYYYYNLLDKLR